VLLANRIKVIHQDNVPSTVTELSGWRPDVVHIHRPGDGSDPLGAWALACNEWGIPLVETNVFGRVDHSAAADSADVRLFLSRWCLDKWRQWTRRMSSITGCAAVLPYMIDVEEFSEVTREERVAARRELGLSESGFVFGRIGQPYPAKWSLQCIRAFEKCCRNIPGFEAVFALVGAPDSIRDAVNRLPAPVRDRIPDFPMSGDDQRIKLYYAAFDFFLHTSAIGESFGMVIGEAMARGIPVITRSTPHKDNTQITLVRHGITGYVAHSEQGLVTAMERAWSQGEAERAIMGERGRSYMNSRYSYDAVLPRLEEILGAAARHQGDRRALSNELAALKGDPWSEDGSTGGFGRVPVVETLLSQMVRSPFVYDLYRSVRARVSNA
jgi:glycosyltransferase involved in cell wall biosynthesis